jgi:hypothetical protein
LTSFKFSKKRVMAAAKLRIGLFRFNFIRMGSVTHLASSLSASFIVTPITLHPSIGFIRLPCQSLFSMSGYDCLHNDHGRRARKRAARLALA